MATKAPPAPAGGKKVLGLKGWQLGLVAVVFIGVLYYIYKRSQSTTSTSTTDPSAAVDASGATSGQPDENSVPAPSVVYNIYPPNVPAGGGNPPKGGGEAAGVGVLKAGRPVIPNFGSPEVSPAQALANQVADAQKSSGQR